MSFFDQISKSLSYHGKAFGFIIANKFAWTLFVPIVVFIVLLGFGIFAVGSYFADMLVDMAGELLEESPFLITIFSTFIIIVIRILLFIIFGLWGGYVVVVIMSPFLAYVSEKTETILSGREYKFDFPQFIHDIFRGIALAVRNMFMEFLISIVIFFLPVIPIIGALTSVTVGTVFLFFVSAYFYGFSFIDYTLERRRLTARACRDIRCTAPYKTHHVGCCGGKFGIVAKERTREGSASDRVDAAADHSSLRGVGRKQ